MTTLHDREKRGFASDNYAGLHPEVLAALADANGGHEIAYGEDAYTARLQEVVAGHVGAGAVTWPVFNGTGANVVALQALLPRWGAVVCAETAHINTDEGGAPERMGSIKLLSVPTSDGKLTPELVDRQAWGFGDEHRAQPLVVSITQTTELGTCYTPAEVKAIADHAHSLGMRVHLDGARIANAAATLGTDLSAFTSEAGVDVVSLGGTKNGALAAEAVVVVDPELAADPSLGLVHVRKLSMQLASKMRFVSAQLVALYEGDLWLRSATHANAMASRLAAGVGELAGVAIQRPVQSNAVFAVLDRDVANALRERFRFYDWDPATGEVRWMCSWDTTEADVDAFVGELRRLLGA
ncbi:low specificity L-threonine aldolase [Terrabacter sp. NPDC000476]|uniref:threonine aldolase family protein n=1 Tax=Terrabacter sp. NPDC000476 TaxID=3154258 RepID=UPI00332D7808